MWEKAVIKTTLFEKKERLIKLQMIKDYLIASYTYLVNLPLWKEEKPPMPMYTSLTPILSKVICCKLVLQSNFIQTWFSQDWLLLQFTRLLCMISCRVPPYGDFSKKIELYSPWQNAVEKEIKELKKCSGHKRLPQAYTRYSGMTA